MNYIVHILTLVCVYATLAASLNLLIGYTGLLSLCHAAFWGIGAYSTGLLCAHAGFPWSLGVLLGIALSSALAAIVGILSLRFRDEQFVMVTFAFQVLISSLMLNWTELTKGPMGVPGIPGPALFGRYLDSLHAFLAMSVVLCVFAVLVVRSVVRSPFGRVLKSIREDETYAAALGKNVSGFKVRVFVLTAVLASLAGSLFASYMSYIDPGYFSVHESIFIAALVLIGGSGTVYGPVAGAVLAVTFPEALRFMRVPTETAANLRQVLYGLLLIACMLWRPRGLLGENRLRKRPARE